ncbi:outer membrane beta-barrel protein [Marinobacter sp. M-5]|uniref:outer membrane beta-barrel protein n=1 Tax=Marinobacter sp. M-5 TaxID=3081089 RepID=UPI00293CAB24|nr:outer membrane beta-barrel protein [Marinobacter sp. M-5]MDV3503927.1 outer membrane beta-barrel protein [Marinobacter sp. M-5]
MNKVLRHTLPAVLLPIALLSADLAVSSEKAREDMHYVGLYATALNHRSIGETSNEAAWGQVGTLVVGGHITDLFHAEVRAGGGYKDAKTGDLTLSIDYFASWYLGLHYPITSYANVYAQAGFSHINGDAELTNVDADENRQFREIDGDFPDSSFSISWLAGLDFEIIDNGYLVFEGGRLFKDTGSDVNTFQFSGGIRYEF